MAQSLEKAPLVILLCCKGCSDVSHAEEKMSSVQLIVKVVKEILQGVLWWETLHVVLWWEDFMSTWLASGPLGSRGYLRVDIIKKRGSWAVSQTSMLFGLALIYSSCLWLISSAYLPPIPFFAQI